MDSADDFDSHLRTPKLWRRLGFIVLPVTMMISYILGNFLWYGLSFYWFLIANPVAITLTLLSCLILFRKNDSDYAILCLSSFIVLMMISLLPIWLVHVGEPTENEPHWHNYWEMNHVH